MKNQDGIPSPKTAFLEVASGLGSLLGGVNLAAAAVLAITQMAGWVPVNGPIGVKTTYAFAAIGSLLLGAALYSSNKLAEEKKNENGSKPGGPG